MTEEKEQLSTAINSLDALVCRQVIKELARLVVCYMRARAHKGIAKALFETQAQIAICALSNGARSVIEAGLKDK